jgi:hypothetical protein
VKGVERSGVGGRTASPLPPVRSAAGCPSPRACWSSSPRLRPRARGTDWNVTLADIASVEVAPRRPLSQVFGAGLRRQLLRRGERREELLRRQRGQGRRRRSARRRATRRRCRSLAALAGARRAAATKAHSSRRAGPVDRTSLHIRRQAVAEDVSDPTRPISALARPGTHRPRRGPRV